MSGSVWVVTIPDYDNYDFDLYVSREVALTAIKAEVGSAVGEWHETFNGEQIEFHEQTPVRKLSRGRRIWSLEEQQVYSAPKREATPPNKEKGR